MSIVTIIGTRPQLIKSQLVSESLKKNGIKEYIINTKQHYDKNLNEIFYSKKNRIISLFDNKPFSNESVLRKLTSQLKKIQPKLVVVYGDTNSTLLGALSANLLNIKILHIEAGLRSKNKKMPEEINRIIVDNLSNYFVCPSDNSAKNLLTEGFEKKNIFTLGDPSLDIYKKHKKNLISKSIFYKNFNPKNINLVLLTLHRNTNVDNKNRLRLILDFLENTKLNFIFPIHPRTNSRIKKFNLKIPNNLNIIDPINHEGLLSLINHTEFTITDSGGVQREAYFSKKKCFIIRDDYEWVELIKNQQSKIIYTKNLKIKKFKFDKSLKYKPNLLGYGNISSKIAMLIKKLILD